MNIVRWTPRRDVLKMQQDMDRLMDSFFQTKEQATINFSLALDVIETENSYEIAAAVPGVKAEDIDITFDNHVLTIKGESKAEEIAEGTRYHIRERRYGSFTRNIRLPEGIDAEIISADYDNGVLKIVVPKAEVAQPKRITVNGTNESEAVDVAS